MWEADDGTAGGVLVHRHLVQTLRHPFIGARALRLLALLAERVGEGEAESARTELADDSAAYVLLIDDVVAPPRAQSIPGPNRQAGTIIEEPLAQSEIRPRKRAHTALLRLP